MEMMAEKVSNFQFFNDSSEIVYEPTAFNLAILISMVLINLWKSIYS